MSTDIHRGQFAPPTANPIYEVPDDAASQVVADSISKSLLSSQIRAADKYNDKSFNILQQCIHLLPVREQRRIEGRLNAIGALEDKLESNNSWFRKILLIMEYQHVSKKTYYIVKRASNRLINNQLRDRIRESTHPQARDDQQLQSPAPPPPPIPTLTEPLSSTSNPVHPFRARGESALDSASFHDVERVDLTTLQSSKTGDLAVLLELHTREQRTREYVATLEPTPPDDDMPDGGEGEIPLNTRASAAAEVSIVYGSDMLGPPSDVAVDA